MKALFSPYFPTIGSFWPKCLVQRGYIAGKAYGPTMLYAELVSIDYRAGKCKIQYWHDERKEIAGGLVDEKISGLPVIEGEIDASYRGSFSSKDFKKMQVYDEFESVTFDESAAGGFESVTDGCIICGKPKSARAKTCSPKCRKALSRKAEAV